MALLDRLSDHLIVAYPSIGRRHGSIPNPCPCAKNRSFETRAIQTWLPRILLETFGTFLFLRTEALWHHARSMHLSIIIPAFNEARLIKQTLHSVTAALDANRTRGFTSEIIVVDNNSTDNTADLARQAGARVVFEPINQIGRARNAGAAQATGDWLLFLDADSLLSPGLLAEILRTIESGRYVGCGSTLRMAGLPWWANLTLQLWTTVSVVFRWAAGALVVCRRDAFQEVGGFDQELYALDEVRLSKQLKHWGRPRGLQFTILTGHPLETSSRKVSLYSSREIAAQIFRIFFLPKRTLQDKKHLSVWYDGRR